MHYRIRFFSTIGLLMGSLAFQQAAMAACAITDYNGDAGISMTIESSGIQLGKFTAPDSGSGTTSSVAVESNSFGVDSRTLGSELSINTSNASAHQDIYKTALVNIRGSADCQFSVTVAPETTSSSITDISLIGVGSTTLNSSSSGAIGTLSSTGEATVRVGATVSVSSTSTTASLNSNISITVSFIP